MQTRGKGANLLGGAALGLLGLALACAGGSSDEPPPKPDTAAQARAALDAQLADSVLGAMDFDVDPCDDFYRHACGAWLDATDLPPDKPSYGRSFTVIDERNQELLRRLLESSPSDPGHAKINTYYASCMDERAIDVAGIAPIATWLDEIDTVSDLQEFFEVAGRMQELPGTSPLLGMGIGRDFEDPGTNILRMSQGGIGLPDRDYYLDAESLEIREDYRDHVARMLALAGVPEAVARRDAARILAFETELARISKSRTELRDVEARYHKLDRAGLEALDPSLPWQGWFAAVGSPDLVEINVADPDFFRATGPILRETDVETLQAYLRWNLVRGAAPYLREAFLNERFEFGKKLTGQEELPLRWKRCVRSTQYAFPELVGRVFVAAAFAGDSKDISLEMIEEIEGAFAAGLDELDWMDEETRRAARSKAKQINNKIGYPAHWRDYADVPVRAGRYFQNAVAATTHELRRDLAKVGRPVDPDEWYMSPAVVNAYYSSSANEIVFPAGILQSPFFHRLFPKAMNFGAIGAVMGHELTHGFDDQGRKFDEQGRLRPWWDEAAAERFEARAQCLVDQYDAYEVQPGVSINGRLTLGENIADLGGIKLAHRAYQKWQGEHGESSPVEGMTPEQLLFVAYGQAWCRKATREYERLLARVDTHSPARFRVNGALSNLPAFWEAFSCEEGRPMRSANACEVW